MQVVSCIPYIQKIKVKKKLARSADDIWDYACKLPAYDTGIHLHCSRNQARTCPSLHNLVLVPPLLYPLAFGRICYMLKGPRITYTHGLGFISSSLALYPS